MTTLTPANSNTDSREALAAQEAHLMVDLRAVLNSRLRARYKSKQGIAKHSGFGYENGNSQVGRILNGGIARPAWFDLTRLIIAAGMTPNEAASIAGFDIPVRPSESGDDLSETEQQVIDIMRGLSDDPDLLHLLLSVVRSFQEKHPLLAGASTPPPQPATAAR